MATMAEFPNNMPHTATVPQFITGDFVPQRVFLEDDVYGLALDALVKVCSLVN